MTQHTRDTIKKEFYNRFSNGAEGSMEDYKNWFLNKFDTLLEEKVERIERLQVKDRTGLWLKGEMSSSECVDAGYKLAIDTALAIIKE